MITIEDARELIEDLNQVAYDRAWPSWTVSDQQEDPELAEELREEASQEQARYFRDEYNQLPRLKRMAIWNYALVDEEFGDQFSSWYGWLEYQERLQFEKAVVDRPLT